MATTPAAFIASHKMALFAGGVGLAGLAYGTRRGLTESEGQETGQRIETTAHHGLATGVAALGFGAAGYAGRGLLQTAGLGAAKRAGAWYTRGMGAAFSEKSLANVFGHRPMALTAGALAGGLLGGMLGDGEPGSVAKGVGMGMLAGAIAYPVARNLAADWKAIGHFGGHPRLGSLAKSGVLLGIAAGVGLATRAYMHQPEYGANDVATPDGMGGYTTGNEAGPSLRDRLVRLHGTGEVVLGLHNRRH